MSCISPVHVRGMQIWYLVFYQWAFCSVIATFIAEICDIRLLT
jgi:hypothetical protein